MDVTLIVKETNMLKDTGVCSHLGVSPASSHLAFPTQTIGERETLAGSWSVSWQGLIPAVWLTPGLVCHGDSPVPGFISALRPLLSLGQRSQGLWDKTWISKETWRDVIFQSGRSPCTAGGLQGFGLLLDMALESKRGAARLERAHSRDFQRPLVWGL